MFDFIARIIGSAGYPGIALLMLLENIVPPLPSELIMPMAGFVAAGGKLSLVGVILAGTLGSVAGALPWYYLGRWLGPERLRQWAGRHGRWLTLTPAQADRVDAWFARHCGKAVFFGRLAPAVRTLVSVPAGLFGMSLRRFLLYTALGSGLWSTALAVAGHSLRDGYAQVSHVLNPATNLVVAAIVLVYVYRVIRWRPATERQA
ncbi:MAG TPA: DedA family protein [Steroidobacteraceae bacterium]|nr:DedA family protein [Steroidobacteraceae bacterium]